LVVLSHSLFEEAREHRLEDKWDPRFLSSCSIEHRQKSEIVAMPPLRLNHSAESRALIK
jgi:hypothetical protein